MKNKPLLFIALACLPLLSSCATLRQLLAAAFQEPELTFKSARLADLSLGGATLELVYDLHNPNDVGLSLAEVDYALSVEGHQVVSGSPRQGLTLPARGRAELTFPATVEFSQLGPALLTFLELDVARYHAQGSLGVDTPIGIVRLPLSYEGSFEVPKIPEITVDAPRISQLTLQGATLEIPLQVRNRNSFPLPLGQLQGTLSIGGARVGTLSVADLGLPGGDTRRMVVPVSFRFAEAASAAMALSRQRGELEFVGELRSGPVTLPIRLTKTVSFQR